METTLEEEWDFVKLTLGHDDLMVKRAFYYGAITGEHRTVQFVKDTQCEPEAVVQPDLAEFAKFQRDVREGRA